MTGRASLRVTGRRVKRDAKNIRKASFCRTKCCLLQSSAAKVCLFAENQSQKGLRDRQQRVRMTAKTPLFVVVKMGREHSCGFMPLFVPPEAAFLNFCDCLTCVTLCSETHRTRPYTQCAPTHVSTLRDATAGQRRSGAQPPHSRRRRRQSYAQGSAPGGGVCSGDGTITES